MFGAIALYNTSAVRSSDHQDSNTVLNRSGADITDVFLFPSPQNANNVVMAMDVHPLIPAGQAQSTLFDPAVMYQFKLVHTAVPYTPGAANANAEDTVIQFGVSGTINQSLSMYGPAAPVQTGTTSSYVSPSASTSIPYGKVTTVQVTGNDGNSYPVKVYAGPGADPFFFDLAQFFKIIPDRLYANQSGTVPKATASSFRGFTAAFNTANGTTCDTTPAREFLSSGGADLVAGANGMGFNVLTIVVEMPKVLLAQIPGTANQSQQIVHLWATTSTTSGS